MNTLAGKVALVTGGAGGIGSAICDNPFIPEQELVPRMKVWLGRICRLNGSKCSGRNNRPQKSGV